MRTSVHTQICVSIYVHIYIYIYLIYQPMCVCILYIYIYTWALKEFSYHSFEVYLSTITLSGAFGIIIGGHKLLVSSSPGQDKPVRNSSLAKLFPAGEPIRSRGSVLDGLGYCGGLNT